MLRANCYGPFYLESMANMISELIQVINSLSELKFDELRNVLPKGSIRSQCAGLLQRYPFERRRVMIKALYIMSRKTFSSVLNKFHPLLYDPHLFLACSSKTEACLGRRFLASLTSSTRCCTIPTFFWPVLQKLKL